MTFYEMGGSIIYVFIWVFLLSVLFDGILSIFYDGFDEQKKREVVAHFPSND